MVSHKTGVMDEMGTPHIGWEHLILQIKKNAGKKKISKCLQSINVIEMRHIVKYRCLEYKQKQEKEKINGKMEWTAVT